MSVFESKRWMADNETEFCSNCNDMFSLLNRKHHCRSCGRLLCSQCCSNWLLIPKSEMLSAPGILDDHTIPQRCCNVCSHKYQGVQSDLRQQNSKANATLRFDKDSAEANMNVPVSRKLETDIRKAAYTLYNFTKEDPMQGTADGIPKELIKMAQGIVFVTILKAGFLFTGRVGTGLVIAKLDDGTWSAPSAVIMSGMGWGFQAGGELTDVILILTTKGAVNAFSSKAQISIGTELAVSLGPVGRSAGGDVSAGNKGASAAFSYAHSKGLFFGISLEATVIASRPDINRQFYGMEITPSLLLNGVQPRPKAAQPLYDALEDLMSDDYDNTASSVSRSGYMDRKYPKHGMNDGSMFHDEDDDVDDVHSSSSSHNTNTFNNNKNYEQGRSLDMRREGGGWDEGGDVDDWSGARNSVEKENADLLRARNASNRRQQQLQQQHEKEKSATGSFTSFSDMLPANGRRKGDAHSPAAHKANHGSEHDNLEDELDSLLNDDDNDDENVEEETVTFGSGKGSNKSDKNAKSRGGMITTSPANKRNGANVNHKTNGNTMGKAISKENDNNAWNFQDEEKRLKVQKEVEKTFQDKEYYDEKLKLSDDKLEFGKSSSSSVDSPKSGRLEEVRF